MLPSWTIHTASQLQLLKKPAMNTTMLGVWSILWQKQLGGILLVTGFMMDQVQLDTSETHANFIICDCVLNSSRISQSLQKSSIQRSKVRGYMQSSSQQNIYHYFCYNRLMDYWHNVNIVNKQLGKMVSKARSGEVVTRDRFYRFIYVCSTCKTPGHTSSSCALYTCADM